MGNKGEEIARADQAKQILVTSSICRGSSHSQTSISTILT